MGLVLDTKRGKEVAKLLCDKFLTEGIHGLKDMPEDIMPKGMEKGSLEHVMFITLTVSIDYQRDAPALWRAARETFEDENTRYLFDPKSLDETPIEKIIADMQKHKLSKKPQKDARIWKALGIAFYRKWDGNPQNFLQCCNWDAPTVLKQLKNSVHLYNGRKVPDYPYLRGDKIGPLWLRMLRDNVGITKLKNLGDIPIPVDIHIARATLTTGVVRGQFKGRLNDLFEHIRMAWFESVRGLTIKNRPMIALDVDEPLWHLSKYGCSKRDKTTGSCSKYVECEARQYCIKGKIEIKSGKAEVNT